MKSIDERTLSSVKSLRGDPRFDRFINWVEDSYISLVTNIPKCVDPEKRSVMCGRALELEILLLTIKDKISFLKQEE